MYEYVERHGFRRHRRALHTTTTKFFYYVMFDRHTLTEVTLLTTDIVLSSNEYYI